MNKLKTILFNLPPAPWCKLAAEERLTKIALNAFDARNMAKSVGLQPAGNWKWALRNMRDGRGAPLQGRELSKAKEGLGKMPNNLRQAMNSSARQTGMSTEIGTYIDKVDGKLEYSKKAPSLKTHEGVQTYPYGDNKVNQDAYRESIGLFEEGPGGKVAPSVKKMLYGEYMTNSLKKEFSAGRINVGTKSSVSSVNPLRPKSPRMQTAVYGEDTFKQISDIHTHPFVPARKYSDVEEIRRGGSKQWPIVTPSGMIDYNKGSKTPGNINGDMASIVHNADSNHVIYDPVHGNEGVHKMRPRGLRSVYFKNQGLYD